MINQNFNDNECFKWCLVRYLDPEDRHSARIRKINKLFGDELDFEDIPFPVKISDVHKIGKTISICTGVFHYERKGKYPRYVSRNTFKKPADLLLIEKEAKGTMFLSKALIILCMIILYIVEKNIFVVNIYKLLVQKKY